MALFKRFAYWKNRRCSADLHRFRSDLENYIDHSSYHWMAEARIEDEPANNRSLHRVADAIDYTGLPSIVIFTPPPAVGGYQQPIDLISNLFDLHQYQIPQSRVIELIDRAIGIYEDDKWPAIIRSINPLWWFWKGLVFISSGPFKLLSIAGFDTTNIENSIFGRLVRLTVMLFTLFASLLTVLQILGYIEQFKNLVGLGPP